MIETVVHCDWCGKRMQSVQYPGVLGTLPQDVATILRVGAITYAFEHTCSECKKKICEAVDDLKFQLANNIVIHRIPRDELKDE